MEKGEIIIESNQSFIKISHNFFDSTDTENMYKQIGSIGFTIYTCLLIEKQQRSTISISIKAIKEIINIKDTRTIINYLNTLIYKDIIKIDNKTTDDKIKVNDILIIKFNDEWSNPSSFTIMSEELFNNKIHNIKPIGWGLLCLLSKLHNYKYGTLDSDHTLYLSGYSCPSEEIIMNYLGVSSKSTISEYITLLENLQLISVIRTTRMDTFKNNQGKYEYKRPNNKYIVHSRIPEKRYFLEILMPKYKTDMNEKSKSKIK